MSNEHHSLPTCLFVYGSLRRGSTHPMSEWLAGQARFLGEGWIRAALFRVSWYPAVIPDEGRVRGDVYLLPDAAYVLAQLDAFEAIRGLPGDEYERRLSEVEGRDGRWWWAWVYWYRLPVEGLERVVEGDWLLYREEMRWGSEGECDGGFDQGRHRG